MLNFILAVSLLFSGAPLDWWNDSGVMTQPTPVGGMSRWEDGNTFYGNLVEDNSGALLYHGQVKVVVGDPIVTSTQLTVKFLSLGSSITMPTSEVSGTYDRGRMNAAMMYRCQNTWAGVGNSPGFMVNTVAYRQQPIAYTYAFELKNYSLISQCAGSVTNVEEVRVMLQQTNTTGIFPGSDTVCHPNYTAGAEASRKWASFWNSNGGEALPECWTDPASYFNTFGGHGKIMRIYAGQSQIQQSTEALTMGRCYQLFPNGQIYPNAKTMIAGVEYTALQLGCTRMSDQELEDYYNSFDYLCRDAPEWSWTDPGKIAPWTFHYAKCLTVPENISTTKFNDALDASFIGQIKNINWSFGTGSAADCGPLISQDVMNANFNVNTCDWKEKLPGVVGWRNAFGYIFVGLIGISAVFFIFRTFGGSKQ